MFLLLFSLLIPSIKSGPTADHYNGTDVRVDGIFYKVVSCAYKNETANTTKPFTIPTINYKNTSNFQSLFLETRLNNFERSSCSNAKVSCDCMNDKDNVMGYKCICPHATAYAKRTFNETSKKFFSWCEKFNSMCERCHPQHTEKCLITNNTINCKCIIGYDSLSFCFEPFNACLRAPEGSSLSGNEACIINENNKCIPFLSFQKYLCQCFYPNQENQNLGFQNCMGMKMKKCDSILCINEGVCDPFQNGKCICKKGFSGKFCEIIKYKFIGSWTVWSSCYPDCGNYGLRSSEAICEGSHSSYCSGVMRKWERCAAISCDLKLLSRLENKTIQGLRLELAKMLTLTPKESIILIYILILGGFTTGLIYIYIVEIFRFE